MYLEKKCDFKIGCQIDTNLFVYCREITCFSFKPKILVPNYLDKKNGETITTDTFNVWFPCLYCLIMWKTTFLGVQLYIDIRPYGLRQCTLTQKQYGRKIVLRMFWLGSTHGLI